MEYPYNSPVVMTDVFYVAYGGHTGSSTVAQRQAAYWMAERAVSEDLDTLLLPATVTGTYLVDRINQFIVLDHSRVSRVLLTRFIDDEETIYWTATGTANVYVSLRDGERGLVDVHYLVGNCNCHSHGEWPYKIQVIYEAGFSTGTSTNADFLMALTTYSDILLNEIIGYGNEAPGDVGVQSYTNQEYSERRIGLLRTSLGTSARANFAAKLITKYKRRRYVGMI